MRITILRGLRIGRTTRGITTHTRTGAAGAVLPTSHTIHTSRIRGIIIRLSTVTTIRTTRTGTDIIRVIPAEGIYMPREIPALAGPERTIVAMVESAAAHRAAVVRGIRCRPQVSPAVRAQER